MRTSHCNLSHDPITLSDLTLDRQVQIGIGIADAQYMCLCALNANGMPDVVVDFHVIRGNELGHAVHVTGVHNFHIVLANQVFVLFRRQSIPSVYSTLKITFDMLLDFPLFCKYRKIFLHMENFSHFVFIAMHPASNRQR